MAGFESGTRFPFISLEKALDRAEALYKADHRGNEMPISGAFAVWGYSGKSSGGFQTIAALKGYGLLEDVGASDARKVKLTKHALDYFRDERPDFRAQKLQDFATNPPMFQILFNSYWGAEVPDDAIARSVLKIQGELNEQSARSALGIYRENIAFAKLKGHAKKTEPDGDKGSVSPPPNIKVGDYVQWTSNGVDQFKPVRRVTKVKDDHVWVFGSNTGIPMEQVKVTDPPAPKPLLEAGVDALLARPANTEDVPQIDVLLRGNRLQITADVDAAGLAKLKDVLAKYEEILNMLK